MSEREKSNLIAWIWLITGVRLVWCPLAGFAIETGTAALLSPRVLLFSGVVGGLTGLFIERMVGRSHRPRGVAMLLMSSRRFRWALVVVAILPLTYVGSFGPVCWIVADQAPGEPSPIWLIYAPLSRASFRSETELVRLAVHWWAGIGIAPGSYALMPLPEGNCAFYSIP